MERKLNNNIVADNTDVRKWSFDEFLATANVNRAENKYIFP